MRRRGCDRGKENEHEVSAHLRKPRRAISSTNNAIKLLYRWRNSISRKAAPPLQVKLIVRGASGERGPKRSA